MYCNTCRDKVLLSQVKTFGIPYRWVQLLCGLDLLTESPKVRLCDVTISMYSMSLMQSAKVNITKSNIDKIMIAIKKRISMRVILQNEINKMVGSLEGMQYYATSQLI